MESHVKKSRLGNILENDNHTENELQNLVFLTSHELRVPLRNIKNLANWLQHDAGDTLAPKSLHHLSQLKEQVAWLEQLFNDLVEFSLVGKNGMPPIPVRLHEITQKVIDGLQIPSSFEVKNHCANPIVPLPQTHLEAIFKHLIWNAIKHHHTETGTVEVFGDVSKDACNISIRDDGPGIPHEYHDCIFDLFQSLKPRSDVKGTGMGLAIVKRLVQHYNGSIKILSEPGKGATFNITLPLEGTQIKSTGSQSATQP